MPLRIPSLRVPLLLRLRPLLPVAGQARTRHVPPFLLPALLPFGLPAWLRDRPNLLPRPARPHPDTLYAVPLANQPPLLARNRRRLFPVAFLVGGKRPRGDEPPGLFALPPLLRPLPVLVRVMVVERRHLPMPSWPVTPSIPRVVPSALRMPRPSVPPHRLRRNLHLTMLVGLRPLWVFGVPPLLPR